jgi:5,5'-dehydrodivanillate O-demethylase
MLTREQNETLTRCGPGTPMGELLRRYWFPVALSSGLPRGSVRKVRLLCEDLALYRLASGEVSLLEDRCPHRGVALSRGMVEDNGLRCPYHGWLFDGSGACREQPGEPAGSGFACKVRAKSYPVQELGGLVFAYLGPSPAPALPRYDLYCWDDAIRDIGHAMIPCNFLQTMENAVDLDHVAWLHGRYSAWLAGRGVPIDVPRTFAKLNREVRFEATEYGILMRRQLQGQDAKSEDWSVGHPFIFPNMVRIGGGGSYGFHLRVPVDDQTSWALWYTAYRPGEQPVPQPGPISSYEVPFRDDDGELLPDSIEGQDILAWVTQGPIADRTREQLGTIDKGVIMLRRMFFEQMERVRQGEDPICVLRGSGAQRTIDFPQERNKFGDGTRYVRDFLTAAHARFSRRHADIARRYVEVGLDLSLDGDGASAPVGK